jgi:uncharacterized protein YjiS (DUF1127 family)
METGMATNSVSFRKPARQWSARDLGALLASAMEVIGSWYGRYRQRRALAALSDSMLKDLGLSRGEAYRESAKPFWQA